MTSRANVAAAAGVKSSLARRTVERSSSSGIPRGYHVDIGGPGSDLARPSRGAFAREVAERTKGACLAVGSSHEEEPMRSEKLATLFIASVFAIGCSASPDEQSASSSDALNGGTVIGNWDHTN